MHTLQMWTVYEYPSDFPDQYVARCWQLNQPTGCLLKADTLEELREMLPPDLVCLPRQLGDDPCIVEVWL